VYWIVHKASFLCVQHYSLHPNSYFLALCLYQRLEAGGERDVRVGVLLCRIAKLVSSVYNITVFIKIVTFWLCVCISSWKLEKRGEVRVGVLLFIG
jgi:hypothetical protein